MDPGGIPKPIKAARFKGKRAVKSEPLSLSISSRGIKAVKSLFQMSVKTDRFFFCEFASLGVLEVTGGRAGVQRLEFLMDALKNISSPSLWMLSDIVSTFFPKKKSDIC